jgi:hypothetical protein
MKGMSCLLLMPGKSYYSYSIQHKELILPAGDFTVNTLEYFLGKGGQTIRGSKGSS